ncbi:MAG: BrnT family toxin [Nitrospira sp.]|nr:BrnT family toxin [Nitrospira sp.]
MVFEWDPKKATANEVKHGISFEEAGTAFFDPGGIDGDDLEHSSAEPRRLRLARSAAGSILVIAYTLRSRGHEKTIRIISARLANRKEKKGYQEKAD